jgi:hypothetical protein
MSLIELELIEQLFSAAEKEEILTQLKNAMVSIRHGKLGPALPPSTAEAGSAEAR